MSDRRDRDRSVGATAQEVMRSCESHLPEVLHGCDAHVAPEPLLQGSYADVAEGREIGHGERMLRPCVNVIRDAANQRGSDCPELGRRYKLTARGQAQHEAGSNNVVHVGGDVRHLVQAVGGKGVAMELAHHLPPSGQRPYPEVQHRRRREIRKGAGGLIEYRQQV